MANLLKRVLDRMRGRRKRPGVEPFPPNDRGPRAFVQVSPARQPNGVFVNYGDASMWWAGEQQLQRRGWSVLSVPRERLEAKFVKAQKARLFIDCGGFIYSAAHRKSMKSAHNAGITLENLRSAKRAGAVAVSAPQSFGPFDEEPDSELSRDVRDVLREMDLICVRDAISASHLQALAPDLVQEKLRLVPDWAFLYEVESRHPISEVLERKGLRLEDRSTPLVGLSLNRQVYDRVPSYLDTMGEVVGLFRRMGARVVLIPHEHGRFGQDEKDDQFLCEHLGERAGVVALTRRQRLSREEETAFIEEVEAVLGSLDFLVASRFHAAVRGLSESVPTVAISWSHKFEQLIKTVGVSFDPHVVSLEELQRAAHDAGILGKLEAAWRGRDETRALLQRSVPSLKAQVSRHFDEITAMAASAPGGAAR